MGRVAALSLYNTKHYQIKASFAEHYKACQVPKHGYKRGGNEHVAILNHLDRQFEVTKSNQAWCSDVTYIWAGSRWCCLAVVIDLIARKAIG